MTSHRSRPLAVLALTVLVLGAWAFGAVDAGAQSQTMQSIRYGEIVSAEQITIQDDVSQGFEGLQVTPCGRPRQARSIGDLRDGEVRRVRRKRQYDGQAALESLNELSRPDLADGGTLHRGASTGLTSETLAHLSTPLRETLLWTLYERMFAYRTESGKTR